MRSEVDGADSELHELRCENPICAAVDGFASIHGSRDDFVRWSGREAHTGILELSSTSLVRFVRFFLFHRAIVALLRTAPVFRVMRVCAGSLVVRRNAVFIDLSTKEAQRAFLLKNVTGKSRSVSVNFERRPPHVEIFAFFVQSAISPDLGVVVSVYIREKRKFRVFLRRLTFCRHVAPPIMLLCVR